MKRFLLLVTIIGLFGSATHTQDDVCDPNHVINSFALAASQDAVPLWMADYLNANCSEQIEDGMQLLAAAYDAMTRNLVPFETPNTPGLLNPVLNWRPGESTSSQYQLADEGETLAISAGPNTDQWNKINTGPIMAYPLSGDFVVQIQLAFDPSGEQWKSAGLGIRHSQDYSTWLRIISVLGNNHSRNLYLQSSHQGSTTGIDVIPYDEEVVYLKLGRMGTNFTISYSPNGIHWTIAQESLELDFPEAVEIFLLVYSTSEENATAQFQDFFVTRR